MSNTINLGRVTAYADAVAAGYTGTREQFAHDLANAANYAAEAGDAAETATEAATAASTAAETATDKAEEASADADQAHADAQAILGAKETAVAAAATASSKAGEAANSAQQAAASETAAAGSATTASNAATRATASQNAAATSETNAANSANAAAQTLTNVNQAGATQVAAIQAKGNEVLNSIPADYTELSNNVDDLKSDLNYNKQATPGYVLRATNTGNGSEWAMVGTPTDAQAEAAIANWLNDHPEATTTVDFNIVAKVYDNVSEMYADTTLKNGDNARTNGYFSVNDGGGCFYKIATTKQRACAIQLSNGLFANIVGDRLTSRQIGLFANDYCHEQICEYIADVSFSELNIIDPLNVKKDETGSAIDNIELIKIRRNSFTLKFSINGKISLVTNNEDYYRIIAVAGCNNIKIICPTIIGDKDTIGVATGEYGHGIYIRNATNVVIESPNISKCFGDGIDIDGNSEHIQITGLCRIDDVHRNGISIVWANDVHIERVYASNIVDAYPQCAIDIETNSNTNDTTNIIIDNVYAFKCGDAVNVVHGGNHVSVNIGNIVVEQCTKRAISCGYVEAIDNNRADTTPVNENNTILISAIKAVSMANNIASFTNLSKSKTSKLVINSIECIDYSQNTASESNAIVLYNYQNTDNIMNGVGRFTVNYLNADANNVRFLTIYRATPTTFNFDDIHVFCIIPTTFSMYANVASFDNSEIVHNPNVHDLGTISGNTISAFASQLLNAVYGYSSGFYNIYGQSSYYGYFTGFARTLNQSVFISVVMGEHNLYIMGTTANHTVYDNGEVVT